MKIRRPRSSIPKKTVVVGGGNVAMDAARCARRLGSEVYIVYRRSLEELPARKEEVEHAMEEGIIFKLLNNPVAVHGDEKRLRECGGMHRNGTRRTGRFREEDARLPKKEAAS